MYGVGLGVSVLTVASGLLFFLIVSVQIITVLLFILYRTTPAAVKVLEDLIGEGVLSPYLEDWKNYTVSKYVAGAAVWAVFAGVLYMTHGTQYSGFMALLASLVLLSKRKGLMKEILGRDTFSDVLMGFLIFIALLSIASNRLFG